MKKKRSLFFGQPLWAFIIKAVLGLFFLLVAFSPDRSVDGWLRTSIIAVLIAVAFLAWLIIPVIKSTKKRSEAKAYIPRSANYKDFPISDLKNKYLIPYSYDSDDYSITIRQIIADGLEDERIYKTDHRTIRPTISDNGNGYDILVDDHYVGKLDPDTADALDSFLDAHPDHELLISVTGGYYKIYDSEEEEIIEDYEQFSAKLSVKYYVAKSK